VKTYLIAPSQSITEVTHNVTGNLVQTNRLTDIQIELNSKQKMP